LLWNEIAVSTSITCIGLLSDRIGRRIVYTVGVALMGASIFIHPFAENFLELVIFRIIFALGASASVSMLTAILGDYPSNSARGRAGGIMGLMSGLGALLALFVFLRIPSWIQINGTKGSGEVMYWLVGGWMLINAMILWAGLSDKINPENKHASVLSVIVDGAKAATNPRVVLAYMASFAARGDSIVLTSFLSLWVHNYESDKGTPEEAIAYAGVISGIAQVFALVFAVPFGFLADRIDRVFAQLLAAIIAAGGYLMIFLLPAPEGAPIYIAIALVGIGEIGMIVGGQVLIAAEAPTISRGAVSGFFGLMGSLAILLTTKLGGYLFDAWTPTAPFLIVGIFNIIVFLAAGSVLIGERLFECCKRSQQEQDQNSVNQESISRI